MWAGKALTRMWCQAQAYKIMTKIAKMMAHLYHHKQFGSLYATLIENWTKVTNCYPGFIQARMSKIQGLFKDL